MSAIELVALTKRSGAGAVDGIDLRIPVGSYCCNLDPFLRVRAELKALQRQLGIVFVHVTHGQEEAIALADLVVVIQAGQIRQSARRATSSSAPPTASSPTLSAVTTSSPRTATPTPPAPTVAAFSHPAPPASPPSNIRAPSSASHSPCPTAPKPSPLFPTRNLTRPAFA